MIQSMAQDYDYGDRKMKTGLVMEGGAMRGMFTAGVIDVMMEKDIEFEGAIGVSAGAVFGCNYKSKQIGRVIRYNKRFCGDKRYCSISSLVKTGDLYNADFDYRVVPRELDIFDEAAFRENPMEFYAVVTDAQTGEAVYRRLENGDDDDILWMRASASMPALSQMVDIDNRKYSDGGTADAIPIRYFESIGYGKNVVILTQPQNYRKQKNKYLPLLKIILRKYPKLVEALANRHELYNETLSYIEQAEKEGRVFVIRPPEALNISAGEKKPDELERVYQIGRVTAEKSLKDMCRFLGNSCSEL